MTGPSPVRPGLDRPIGKVESFILRLPEGTAKQRESMLVCLFMAAALGLLLFR